MASAPSIFADVPEWPEANPRAVAGDNRPPMDAEAKAAFRQALLADRPEFESRLAELEAAADRVEITDDDQYGRAGAFIKQMRAAADHISEAHKTAKEPYLTAGRAVDTAKNLLIGRLDTAKGKVQPKMNQYAADREARERAERERIAAEQRRLAEIAAAAERERVRAEQEAQEAAAAATNEQERRDAEARAAYARNIAEVAMAEAALAPAAPTKAEPVRSDYGSTVSSKQVWNSKVDSYPIAFKEVADDAAVREAIDKAVARLVRAGKREIKGCTIWPTTQAVSR